LIAVFENKGPKLIPNSQGNFLTPSVISLDSKGNVVVGKPVIDQLDEHQQISLASFKRYMGTNKTLHLGRHVFRPEELSALILKSLIRDAEIYLRAKVTEAIITVPAYFNDVQRKATRLAGELAGLKVERLLNEPTAAAIAYGLHNRNSETKFLIFDLGGGTFDVSIVELFSGVIEVHSSAGDNYLGGDDFTDLLEEYIQQEISKKFQIHCHELNVETKARWRHHVQMLLHELSKKNEAKFSVTHNGQLIEMTVTSQHFKQCVHPLMERIRNPLERALQDARILPHQLDAIILVGGETRMPVVREEVIKLFGKFPLFDLHPDEAIALGAAVQAAMKQKHQDLRDIVITDVCPFTLGTDILEDKKSAQTRFFPIIERNSIIPISRVERFYTSFDYQTTIEIGIYQGESYRIEENVNIGKVSVRVPSKPEGEEAVDVRYTYDVNGLLEVDVMVASTGTQKKLLINNQSHHLTEDQIAASLEKLKHLKIHPREQTKNRQLMAELEQLYQLLKGDRRQIVGDKIRSFNKQLDRQDSDEIAIEQESVAEFIASFKSTFDI
jgi:molecular chaperone HscC